MKHENICSMTFGHLSFISGSEATGSFTLGLKYPNNFLELTVVSNEN